MRIGVIGAGNMGKNHIRIIKELPKTYDMVGFFDTSAETAKLIEEAYNVKSFNSMEELLENVEAVIVAVPSSLHKEVGLIVAEYGVHALIEKPIALSKEDGDILCQAFANKNKLLMVGHVERFNPITDELVKILENEEIIAIDIRRCSPFDSRATDTNVIMDLMIHDLDLVLHKLCNKNVESITAMGASIKSDKCDYVHAIMKHETGIITSLTASRVTEEKIRMIEVHTKNAYIKANLLDKTLVISRKTNYTLNVGYNSTYTQENIMERIFVPIVEPLKAELIAFHDSIQNNNSAISGYDGVHNIQVADEIQRQL